MIGWDGEEYRDVSAYLLHLADHLPDSYRAGRDFRDYVEVLRQVGSGDISADQAARTMPSLRRVGGVCPCSRAVRWVVDEPTAHTDGGNGHA